jgi:beta-glucosidase
MDRDRAGAGETVRIALDVTNSGSAAGEEVVQLYTRDEYASSPRPVKELRGFARIALDPGETARVTFALPIDQLAFYNNDLDLVLEPGRTLVMVGSSSADIRLEGEFEIVGDDKMCVAERVFVCPVEVNPTVDTQR